MNTSTDFKSKLNRCISPLRDCYVAGPKRSRLQRGFIEGAKRWLRVIALTPLAVLTHFAICMVGATIGMICLFDSCLTKVPEPLHTICLHYISYCIALSYCLGLVFMALSFVCFRFDYLDRYAMYLRLSLALVLASYIAGFLQPLSNELAHKVATGQPASAVLTSKNYHSMFTKFTEQQAAMELRK